MFDYISNLLTNTPHPLTQKICAQVAQRMVNIISRLRTADTLVRLSKLTVIPKKLSVISSSIIQ